MNGGGATPINDHKPVNLLYNNWVSVSWSNQIKNIGIQTYRDTDGTPFSAVNAISTEVNGL